MLATADYIFIIAVTLTKFKELLKLSLLYRRRKIGMEDCSGTPCRVWRAWAQPGPSRLLTVKTTAGRTTPAPPESIRTASKRLGRCGSDPVGKQSHCRTSRTWQTGRPSSPEKLCKQKKEPFFRGKAGLTLGSVAELSTALIRYCRLNRGQKKSPDHSSMIRGCPSLSTYRRRPPDPRREAVTFQAGILTPGSSSHRVFPTLVSDMSAVFVPGYSGGPVSDFHGVPNYSSKGT